MKKILSVVVLSAIILGLSGCASKGNESLRSESEVSVKNKIIENVTTKNDLKKLFGSPETTSFTGSGHEIWKYIFENVSADAVSYIPIVSMFGASASGIKKELTILFNENDTVKKFTMSESQIKTKTGLFNN